MSSTTILTIADSRSDRARSAIVESAEHEAQRGEAALQLDQSPNMQLLGTGYFSRVYAVKDRPGTVVKIGQYGRLGRYGTMRKPGEYLPDGWLAYVKWTAENPSPFAPVVHRLELHDGYFIAEMEALRWHDPSRWEERRVYRNTFRHPGRDHAGTPLGEYGARIEQFAAESGFDMDCHKQNLMFRADGTPVITDPLA